MRSQNLQLTEGPLIPTVFRFSIPLILGALLQNLFNMADQIVLGQMAGSQAVASVGACTTVVTLVVNLFCGLSGGVTVVLARVIGAKDGDRARTVIYTAMISSVFIGLFAAAIAIPLVGFLLDITACPSDIRRGAEIYLTLYYAAVPAITVYNFGAAILRVSGDSLRPTVYLILSGALNVILNVVLCLTMREKVAAVALATMFSQILGAVLTVVRLFRTENGLPRRIRDFRFSFRQFGILMKYGVPTALSSSVYCLANLQIQAGINSYGKDATCGNTASISLENVLASFSTGFNHTASAMVGQNIGAKNQRRVKESILYNTILSTAVCSVLAVLLFLFRRPIFSLTAPDSTAAVEYASTRACYVLITYGLCAFNNIMGAIINAYGYTFIVMCSSILTTIVMRPLWMKFIYPRVMTFDCIMLCFTFAWTLTFLILTPTAIIVYKKNRVDRKKSN